VEIPTYSFDTNIFISRRHYYPPDIFQNFWKQIELVIGHKEVIASEMVLVELSEKDDEIFNYAKQMRNIFVTPNRAQQDIVTQIQNQYPDWIKSNAPKNRADPFVIALAIDAGLTVVTMEKGGSQTAPKIPYVCQEWEVGCIHFFDFLRQNNIQA
jgi:hypothetical protein